MKELGLLLALLLGAVPMVRAGAQSDRELIGQLDREVIALRQKVARLEAKAGDCGGDGETGKIYPELVQVFSGSTVTVERKGSEVRVTLPADVLFSGAGLTVREEANFALDLLATALKLHEVRALVVGHTDSDLPTGSAKKYFPTNWELSSARASAVTRVLVDRYQVPPARITVGGRADTEPLSSNDTPEGRAINRRVVIHILPGAKP